MLSTVSPYHQIDLWLFTELWTIVPAVRELLLSLYMQKYLPVYHNCFLKKSFPPYLVITLVKASIDTDVAGKNILSSYVNHFYL